MWELLTNNAAFMKFLAYVALIPLVLRFTERVEEEKLSDEEKREKVSYASVATIKELSKRGYIPESALKGLDKTAAELHDIVVPIYVAAGFFKPRKKKKGDNGPESEAIS